ncbi:MAG: hypothetical protein JWP89_1129 [Schlesneria sp.]|nr:hypothetical protein [Schlesneria sp.]
MLSRCRHSLARHDSRGRKPAHRSSRIGPDSRRRCRPTFPAKKSPVANAADARNAPQSRRIGNRREHGPHLRSSIRTPQRPRRILRAGLCASLGDTVRQNGSAARRRQRLAEPTSPQTFGVPASNTRCPANPNGCLALRLKRANTDSPIDQPART